MSRLALVLVVVLAGFACAKGDVTITERWPGSPQPYEDEYDVWTRHEWIVRDGDTILDSYATLKSLDWRAAYVEALYRRADLDEKALHALVDQEKKAYEEAWEIEFTAATHHYSVNDFDRGKKSMWHLTLTTAEGEVLYPISVKEDFRPKPELRTWFPDLSPFHRAYVVRFPKVATRKLTLRAGSSQGNTTYTWGR